ncbi:baseplate J/gp47 family protein [Phreatobacter stygius]|uniref:Baseplate protein J-like barrel domain-containing protein n=1 Tax=Phreatobacter stygius TaxID=1940610 RepID=A0A4D7AZ74_9HYPH|nr:baseplate J/gp47 family protein [Phreatobacter stygius]QCI65621.1 hypothetical protein E8M01_16255 [Phreatobacter stygius]
MGGPRTEPVDAPVAGGKGARHLAVLHFRGPTGDGVRAGRNARRGRGQIVFATLAPASIAIGASSATVTAEALEEGTAGNGFLPGQLTSILDPVGGVAVTNITESSGGADIEDIELYRLRLANAYERISTGGSWAWYRETTMGVSSAIIDVAIIRPSPCFIEIYPLTATGAAGVDLRDQVAATFNTASALDIRFGDDVSVKPPIAVTSAPVVTVRVRRAASTIQADALAAATGVLDRWRQSLGSIIAPSEVEAAIRKLRGVVDAEVSAMPFQRLARNEFLVATSLTINVMDLS